MIGRADAAEARELPTTPGTATNHPSAGSDANRARFLLCDGRHRSRSPSLEGELLCRRWTTGCEVDALLAHGYQRALGNVSTTSTSESRTIRGGAARLRWRSSQWERLVQPPLRPRSWRRLDVRCSSVIRLRRPGWLPQPSGTSDSGRRRRPIGTATTFDGFSPQPGARPHDRRSSAGSATPLPAVRQPHSKSGTGLGYLTRTSQTLSPEDVDRLVSYVIEVLQRPALGTLNWFDQELEPITGIDVYATPFDYDNGYEMYENDVCRVTPHSIREPGFGRDRSLRGLLWPSGYGASSKKRGCEQGLLEAVPAVQDAKRHFRSQPSTRSTIRNTSSTSTPAPRSLRIVPNGRVHVGTDLSSWLPASAPDGWRRSQPTRTKSLGLPVVRTSPSLRRSLTRRRIVLPAAEMVGTPGTVLGSPPASDAEEGVQ